MDRQTHIDEIWKAYRKARSPKMPNKMICRKSPSDIDAYQAYAVDRSKHVRWKY